MVICCLLIANSVTSPAIGDMLAASSKNPPFFHMLRHYSLRSPRRFPLAPPAMNERSIVRDIFGITATLTLIAMPVWILGGNLPPVRTLCLGLSGLFGLLMLLLDFRRPAEAPESRLSHATKIVLLTAVVFAAIQAIEHPANFLQSIYPAATRLRLAELVLGVMAFFFFSRLFISQRLLIGFLLTVLSTGAAVSLFGLVQRLTWNGKLYGFYELIHGGQPFGPFVNGNNAGGFLLICFSAGAFFVARQHYDRRLDSLALEARGQGFSGELKDFLIGGLARLSAKQLYVYAGLVAVTAGITASLSRGALISLVVSASVGWLVMFSGRRLTFLISMLILSVSIGITAYAEKSDATKRVITVADSLTSLTDVSAAAQPRIIHWSDTLRASQNYWLTGSGLGTYVDAYLPHQKSESKKVYFHAENQYLETLLELGVVGVCLLLLVIGLCLSISIRLIGQSDATSKAVGLAGLICLLGQILAGSLDFGLYMSANSLLMAGMMGAVVARNDWLQKRTKETGTVKHSAYKQTVSRVCFGVALLSACWGAYEYSGADAGKATSRFLARFEPTADSDKIEKVQRWAHYAVSIRGDDAANHLNLAHLAILRYRLAASAALLNDEQKLIEPTTRSAGTEPTTAIQPVNPTEEKAETPVAPPTLVDVWPYTKLEILHQFARATEPEGRTLFENLLDHGLIETHLQSAWSHLHDARAAHPKSKQCQLAITRLSFLFEDRQTETQRIESVVSNYPLDQQILFVCGLLSHQLQQPDRGCDYWRRCMEVTRDYDATIVAYCRSQLTLPQFLQQVVPTDPARVIQIARVYFRAPEDLPLKKAILRRVDELLPDAKLEWVEKLDLRGQAALFAQRYQTATMVFQQVLEKAPDLNRARLHYAMALMGSGQYEEARTQLRICLLQPDSRKPLIRSLLKSVSSRQARSLRNAKAKARATP